MTSYQKREFRLVWEAAENLGLCDGYGGSECRRARERWEMDGCPSLLTKSFTVIQGVSDHFEVEVRRSHFTQEGLESKMDQTKSDLAHMVNANKESTKPLAVEKSYFVYEVSSNEAPQLRAVFSSKEEAHKFAHKKYGLAYEVKAELVELHTSEKVTPELVKEVENKLYHGRAEEAKEGTWTGLDVKVVKWRDNGTVAEVLYEGDIISIVIDGAKIRVTESHRIGFKKDDIVIARHEDIVLHCWR